MKNDVNQNMKYKVMYVAAVADFKGGAEKCLQQFMENPSVEPVLVVPAEGELSLFAKRHSIPVYVIDFGMVNRVRRPFKLNAIFSAGIDAIKVAWKIKRLAKNLNVDCIHSNGLKPHGMLALGRFFGSVPVICHIHDIPYTTKEKIFWRLLALSCQRVLLVSEHCWVSNKLPKNATIVANGIAVSNDSLIEQIEAFGDGDKPIRLGFVGRIHPYKGLHLAIEWLEAARQLGVNCKLYIRGEAAPAEAKYLSEIKRSIDEKGLTEFCAFEGKVSGMDKVYADIDIILMPSVVAEPFGLVAIESFDKGLPCFAYPSGALPSIIEHGKSGFLCENSRDFVTSFKTLLASADAANNIRKNAHNRLKTHYSVQKLYESLNHEYLLIQ